MADLCTVYTYAAVTINPASPSDGTCFLSAKKITGLDGAPVRATADAKGLTDGTNLYAGSSPRRRFFGGRVVTFEGEVIYKRAAGGQGVINFGETAIITAFNTLEAAVVAALEGQLNTATNLAWTPTGGGAKTLSCLYGTPGGEIQFDGDLPNRTYSFTLVSEAAAIS
jgi:hypothetical protein